MIKVQDQIMLKEANAKSNQLNRSKCKQILLLMWKSMILRKRHPILTLMEILIPIVLMYVLIFLKSSVGSSLLPEIHSEETVFPVIRETSLREFLCTHAYGTWQMIPQERCNHIFQLGARKLFWGPPTPFTEDMVEIIRKEIFFDKNELKAASDIDHMNQLVEISYLDTNTSQDPFFIGVFFHLEDRDDPMPPLHLKYDLRLQKHWMTKNVYPTFQITGPRYSKGYFIAKCVRGGFELVQAIIDRAYIIYQTSFIGKYARDGFTLIQTIINKTYIYIFLGYIFGDYVRDGFALIQTIVDRAFMTLLTGKQNVSKDIHLEVQMYPYPPYIKDSGVSQFFNLILPTVVIYCLILLSPTLVKNIVREKETGTKELMRMMGLDRWLLWVGWFLHSFFIVFLICVIITVMLKVNMTAGSDHEVILPPLVAYSNGSVLFIFFLLYGIGVIFFCCAIACFFNRPTLATNMGVLLWLLSYYILSAFIEANYNKISLATKLFFCVVPNVAMTLFFKVVGQFEGRAVGVHWTNLWESGSANNPLSVGMIMVMLLVDIALYILIIWYVDQVLPGKYGVGRPWYFIFQRKPENVVAIDVDRSPSPRQRDPHFEDEPTGLVRGIVIKGLRKEFKSLRTTKVAVDHVNLTCFKGQCTVLLGHNGAGKTTTMSVLTGLYPPTSGSAEMEGWDIKTNLQNARANLGLCLQHNSFFAELTVTEHLLFFARLKGLDRAKAREETETLLERFQLKDKKNNYGKQLSGGMMRKLSLAIALIGGSKVLILDEPTSGLDPESRRWVWDVIQQERNSRTVLVTTHHMEEADILGDRIAIMANGKVVCSGSSLFLKKVFGDGYTLTIAGQEGANLDDIEKFILNHFEKASVKSVNALNYDFQLPPQTHKFSRFLSQLTEEKDRLKIKNFGLSLTTMDQVFLKVCEREDVVKEADHSKGAFENESLQLDESEGSTLTLKIPEWDLTQHSDLADPTHQESKLTGTALGLQRLRSLLMKKLIYSKRKRILILVQALLPVIITILFLLMTSAMLRSESAEKPRPLLLSMFPWSYSFINCHDKDLVDLKHNYVNQFNGNHEINESFNLTKSLLRASMDSISVYREQHVTSVLFKEASEQLVTRVLYQSIPYHTAGIGVNLVDNAILNTFVDRPYKISTTNSPLPPKKTSSLGAGGSDISSFLFGMVMPLPLSFLTTSFLIFPLQERISQSKQIQLMTGTSATLLWLVSYVWDFIIYILTSILIFVIFMLLDSNNYFTVDGARGALFLLLTMYGLSSIPMAYVFSFFFSSSASGFAALGLINLIAGEIISTITVFLDEAGTAKTLYISEVMGNITAFIPSFPLSKGFACIADVTKHNSFCSLIPPDTKDEFCRNLHRFATSSPYIKCCDAYCEPISGCFEKMNYLEWHSPGLGIHLMYLAVDFILYLLILAFIEIGVGKLLIVKSWELVRKLRPIPSTKSFASPDEDIIKENETARALMKEKKLSTTAIVVEDLTKVFNKAGIWAVKGVSFHVQKGECFGFLGVNGAGKTTTFRMLTGDEVRTSGDARIGQCYLSHGRKKFMDKIGYCPQFDAIIDELTGEEMISLIAGLRGIPTSKQPDLVNRLICHVDLTECAKRPCGKYSGGNKRKLSTAIALVGQPPLVFLDEPTTGLDPASRRRVWEAIIDANLYGQSIILTSHSMDECEALCSDIVIMAKGVLKCKGTPRHLKMKFGSGYTLQIKTKSSLAPEICEMFSNEEKEIMYKKTVDTLKEIITSCFLGSTLTDEHRGMISFQVPPNVSLAKIFEIMEALKTPSGIPPKGVCDTLWREKVLNSRFELLIEDFAAMDPSLEQVFLSFARGMQQPLGQETMITPL